MGGSFTDEEYNFLLTNFPQLKSLNIFIESGTYKGDTTRLMTKYYKDIYTFEINPRLFMDSQDASLTAKLTNAHHYFGNCYDLMAKVMAMDTRQCFFFLDAHQSGADIHVTLYQELQVINDNYPQTQFGVVVVDDYRLWNTEPIPRNWQHITTQKIVDSLNKHKISKTFVVNDRMYIFINE
jgi:hypothetical protein